MGFCVWYLLASFALTMNHRFFSHAAFKTSRVWRFVLGVMTLYGMQFGPIWWSSKHRLHHKVCDTPKDPHSWKESSFFYAWIGWFHGHKEQGIDVAYVHPSFLDDEPLFALPSWLIPLHSFGERGSPGYVEGGERRMRPKGGTGKEKVPAPGNFYVNLPPLFLGHFSPIFARFFPIFSPFSPSCPQDSGNQRQDPEERSATVEKRRVKNPKLT